MEKALNMQDITIIMHVACHNPPHQIYYIITTNYLVMDMLILDIPFTILLPIHEIGSL